ncbi:rhodanese-like domain-containing protein [Sulfurospirillum multivorans]|uniref:Sulfurtransferase n=2 Tax=Sulfurospirillum multivorans TaxID=66821 RepID=A0AA86E0Y7_SULMK|nr:rhodanese-like domain-containing protein [Sulfurospirillum multivorans]AHJ14500.1 putative sulfurtransferase [Sulfurospirillum multivorans DSM 12446]QEH07974.1 putative rhodanase [Sulfurospirillum multivorans]QEH07981.1 putative sulfurtransferase [Sulfurospirillum multivorans]
MRLRVIASSLIVAGLLLGGCTNQPETTGATPSAKVLNEPTLHVKGLMEKFKLENVDYAYVKTAIGNGTRSGAKALLIDARPNPKYLGGTIPSSLNIPDTQIDKYIGQLDKVAKDKEIIVFCGGWDCEKSPIVAGHLKSKGFTNVKLYQAGEPEWASKNYLEVGTPVVESAFKKNSALLIDARPYAKTMAESIPGALYMNDEEMPALMGRFPTDKKTPIITFCAGYECHKSHVVANKLLELGYTKVSVYAGGLPAWKEAKLQTTAGAKKVEVATAPKKDTFVEGIKLGEDEGTVDGEWYKALIISDKIPANVAVIDVRSAAEYANGHINGAINIEAGKLKATELAAKLPKGKMVIINCATGGRAMEAFLKLKDAKVDVSKIFYFDANIKCDTSSKCEIKVNEPLG